MNYFDEEIYDIHPHRTNWEKVGERVMKAIMVAGAGYFFIRSILTFI